MIGALLLETQVALLSRTPSLGRRPNKPLSASSYTPSRSTVSSTSREARETLIEGDGRAAEHDGHRFGANAVRDDDAILLSLQ